ncbi:bifunctional 3-(3-hydroxy-phenyl)propionate/3-hydroxycinnamic acid hydroxylase [Actinomycetes bacterium M1A6_2h]
MTHPSTSELHDRYDVVIVGYGPVGRLLALQLGRRGYRIAVIERQLQVYPLPRAVHFDDEIGRILQSAGAGPDVMSDVVEPYDNLYEWRNANRELLLQLDWRGPGPSGWNVSHFFYQPGMEAALDQKVREIDTVDILRGWDAITHTEHETGVSIEIRTADDERRTVTGKFVVGADGANSKVRGWLGSPMTDLGYFHDWLVVDLIPHTSTQFDPPAWQLCDPARPTTLVPGGPGRRRFEFMRLEHETKDELDTEARAWELLEPWGLTADNTTMERHTVYTFQARWCDRWRRGRLLLAGDSAHLMPPFAGQGMCSGLRDVTNLEWKLHLVLSGLASDDILDTYGAERSEHVRHFIDESMALGAVICLTDPAAAAARDIAMAADLAAGNEMPPRPLPRLGAGIHRDDIAGGTLSIQASVHGPSGEALLDNQFPSAGVLLLADRAQRDNLDHSTRETLSQLGFAIIAFGDTPSADTAVDISGAYRRWFDALGATGVLVRPDFYVYGVAHDDYSADALVAGFVTHLGTATAATGTFASAR